MRRHVGETLGGNNGSGGDHRVVAEMEEEAGYHGSRARASESENHANQCQQADEAPGPSELRAVHEAEQDSRDEDASGRAEANCLKRIDTEDFREAREFAGKERIEVAAKD